MFTTQQREISARAHIPAENQHRDGAPSESRPLDSLQIAQRDFGNRFVQTAATCHQAGQESPERQGCSLGSCSGCALRRVVQPKLTIGQASDPYEQEADRAAAEVMRAPVSDGGTTSRRSQLVRWVLDDGAADAPWLSSLGAGRPLGGTTREYMEKQFHADFGNVRLHTDDPAQHAASLLGARAFTYRNHLFMRDGESESDKYLIAHELAHTLQQSGQGTFEEPCAAEQADAGPTLSPVPQGVVQRAIGYPGGSGYRIGDVAHRAWYESDFRLDNIRYIEYSWSQWPNRNCECRHQIKVRVEEYSSVGFLGAINKWDYAEWYWWNHEFTCTGTPEGSCSEHYRKEGPQSNWKLYDEKGDAPQSDSDVLSLIGTIASIAGLVATLALAEAEPVKQREETASAAV